MHAHGHQHGQQDPRGGGVGTTPRQRERERRGLLAALLTTSVILVAELVGGWLSNSLALLADAGHMLSDVLALVLAYLALTFATRPATASKTYGWYRLEILAALLNGVTLVVISIFILWEAWERFSAPPEVRTELMIVIAVIGLVANAVGLYFLSGRGRGLNMRGAYLHVLGDLLSSVGVVLGGAAMWVTGAYWIDPAVSVLIGVVIVVGAFRLLRESVDVLLEATPAGISYDEVAGEIGAVNGVQGVHDLHIWSLTSGMYALSCHVEVKREVLTELEDILDTIRHLMRQRFAIDHTTIQIEPEQYRKKSMIHWRVEPQRNAS